MHDKDEKELTVLGGGTNTHVEERSQDTKYTYTETVSTHTGENVKEE